ncbi:MAG: hypothetical protein PHE27_00915 [Alphaproteobacteria bacterium]|nr:hypothetical protein [Alphaproteobacteria bacterium]
MDPAFETALRKAWSRKTCWGGCRDQYPADGSNPSFGNCVVSVLALWADRDFRGKVTPCLCREPETNVPIWHFQLVDGKEISDPTAGQFKPGTEMTSISPRDPRFPAMMAPFFDPLVDADLRRSLSILLSRMETLGGYKSKYDADKIVDRMQEKTSVALRFRRPRAPSSASPNP